uniref:Uncharacterized protein n=1 Tax=Panagrolaimus sp. ES5 TaxID=591445 RepID=A0AC34GNH4_9BILA
MSNNDVDQNLEQIAECLKKSSKIDQKVWEFVRSSHDALTAFEAFLKSSDTAIIDKVSSVIFKNGTVLTFADSNTLNTKEVYQWVASGIKTVKFPSTAHHSILLQAITDFGSPRNVSFGCQGHDSANDPNVAMFSYDELMKSWDTLHSATIAKPLIIRCFNSISTLECPAKALANFDFQGEILVLKLLKVVAEDQTEITGLPTPKTPPKLYLELKNEIMQIDPALIVDVGWNILEFYKLKNFNAAVNAYRKILVDFVEDPESDTNIMMSKKEKLAENKTLYTKFYIMFNMMGDQPMFSFN